MTLTLVFYAGLAVAFIGFLGILRFIQRVRRLKRTEADAAAVEAELRSLVLLNVASVGLAFLGFAIAVVGLVMS